VSVGKVSDEWIEQLQQLNSRLRASFSDDRLGERAQRRHLLQKVGQLRLMSRLSNEELSQRFVGQILVGVDGSINSFGGQFPYYLDLIRALAKPTRGESIVLKRLHCPMPPDDPEDVETAGRVDQDLRQRLLAELEVQAAAAAIDAYRPAVVLHDGPLVRFGMRAREAFIGLSGKAINSNVLLVGCIENIESKVISTVLGDQAPPGWRDRYDRDLLWGTLDYGEVLEVAVPAKGSAMRETAGGEEKGFAIRTWFMRTSLDPGVVGLDLLDVQADAISPLVDYLFTLSPPDGRGIPIWLDLVDREVRLTQIEVDAYMQLLDPRVKQVLSSKRDDRFF
jgi:hypothetical protein